MIELKNICKSYGDTVVYRDFGLTIEEGKILCVLGESGCGKTTLLNVVAGLTPYSGQVPKLKCSYIFQTPRLIPNLTVKKNLRLVCSDEKKIDGMLDRLEISDKADSFPNALSGGQQQRVAIARAFLFPSHVILMDEPFASLDLKMKIKAMRLFSQINAEERRTAVFVTHDVDEAVMLAERIVILRCGAIVADMQNEGRLQHEYGGNAEMRSALISAMLD